MQSINTKISAVEVSYIYKNDNVKKISKVCLPRDIFDYLSVILNGEKTAQHWVAARASEYKEKYRVQTNSYVREASLKMIINNEFLTGYKIDPVAQLYKIQYIDQDGEAINDFVSIPSAMAYAMRKIELKYDTKYEYGEVINELHQDVHDNYILSGNLACNYSDYINAVLLQNMI